MKESQLKREFDERAVNRARNIISKNFTARTMAGTGYTKKREKHSEGDVWEEDGRTWTIKNGVKQNITRLDSAKKLAQVPLTCPKCSGSMKETLSQKMWKIHKMCFNCVLTMEADLRKAGLYEQYEKQMMQGNMKAWAESLQQWVQDTISETLTFVTEEGDIEDWNTSNTKQKQKLVRGMNEYLTHLKEHME